MINYTNRPKQQYRNNIKIIADITEKLYQNGDATGIATLSQSCNLSHDLCVEKCNILKSKGLVIEIRKGRNRMIKLTHEGIKFKQDLEKIVIYLKTYDLKI